MPDHHDRSLDDLADDLYDTRFAASDLFGTGEVYAYDRLAAACREFLAVYDRPEWTDVDHARHARLHANAAGGCHLALTTGARCAGCAAALDKFHRAHGCRPARDGEPTQPA